MATTIEIHPAIGIARVGSSSEFFLGPEPALAIETQRRDAAGKLKRQAARFRVFECARDASGALVSFVELTPDKATITWKVHLANRKAAAPLFRFHDVPNTDPTKRRNHATGNDAAVPDKNLIIDPGTRSLSGVNQGPAKFDTGKFKGTPVPLGEMRTDAEGRLLVVGGFGTSASNPVTGLGDFADNDNWHDDTSDGPVSARVHFLDGRPDRDADKPAWVIACQPDFAPGIASLVTLYDALEDVAITRGIRTLPTFVPTFDLHVMPILQRALAYQWVNRFNRKAHGPSKKADFTKPSFKDIGDPTKAHDQRQDIFVLLRNPNTPGTDPDDPAMPALFSDDYFSNKKHVFPLTRSQYRILEAWANDNFTKTAPAPTPELLPDAVTRTALEACVGASFCPGIEAGRKIRDANIYMTGEVFRFSHAKLPPGGLTESMALPWQADFSACQWEGPELTGRGWWPAQRPDHVLIDTAGTTIKNWDRGAEGMDEMVNNWDKLGVVLETTDAAGKPVFVETQRDPNHVLGAP